MSAMKDLSANSANLLFVYGTLRRSFRHPMSDFLWRNADYVGAATVQGRLYLVDDYPGLVASALASDSVMGEVARLRDCEYMLNRLDAYEGFDPGARESSEFVRIQSGVRLSGGDEIKVWLYFYNCPVTDLTWLRSGNYFDK